MDADKYVIYKIVWQMPQLRQKKKKKIQKSMTMENMASSGKSNCLKYGVQAPYHEFQCSALFTSFSHF